VLIGGGSGRRPALRGAQECGLSTRFAVREGDRYPQQEIGEGKVGQELPLADEPLYVIYLRIIE
jgi:hypothetical protein